MKFVQMLETNQNEGETWSRWLQLDGNEEAIELLITFIEDEALEDEYEFTGVEADELEVLVLVRLGNFGYGYGAQHTAYRGTLTLPNGFQVDDMYKGQIDKLFKE